MRVVPAVLVAIGATLSTFAGARPAKLNVSQEFAACVVGADRVKSETLVRSEPGTEDEKQKASALEPLIKRCDRKVPNDGQFLGKAMFRGMLAERLWLSDMSGIFTPTNTPASDPNRINYDVGFDAALSLRDNYRMAFCVANTEPVKVDHLLRTGVGLAGEIEIFAELKTTISKCLPVGRSISVDRQWLRALFSEQLYRRYPSQHKPRSRSVTILEDRE